jgi:predicted transposase YdaD
MLGDAWAEIEKEGFDKGRLAGRQEGWQEGRQEGTRDALRAVSAARFGAALTSRAQVCV